MNKSIIRITVLLIIIAVKFFLFPSKKANQHSPTASTSQSAPASKNTPSSKPSATSDQNIEQKNGYTVFKNCKLSEYRNNDGDSFLVNTPDGKKDEYRLYFVDTPESTLKHYRNGQSNADRIAEQAKYFGGITPEAATKAGKEAKEFTLKLLASAPFELSTNYDPVYESGRYYCHIRVNQNGTWRNLDEILTEKGYVRIITKPADLPDGTAAQKHKNFLKSLEANAKKNHLGAWH